MLCLLLVLAAGAVASPSPPPSRQWTTQDNYDYFSGDPKGTALFPQLGHASDTTACQNLCAAESKCHAYTWQKSNQTCFGSLDAHYTPTKSNGFFSGHDPAATPVGPTPVGPRHVGPVPPYKAGACGSTKKTCTSDSDCDSGCGECRCFNSNGAATPFVKGKPCKNGPSYGGNPNVGYCTNDTKVHGSDCWEHPCGNCGGPPIPALDWAKGKKQYLMIGDSVSLTMWDAVNNTLLNSTNDIAPFHAPLNCGPTSSGVSCISEWIGTDLDRWDVITYNFGMWNIGPDDCTLLKNHDGRYVDLALETYIWGLANITATLLETRAGKTGKVFFVNTNPTADVKECCTSAPHKPGQLQTHSCYQRTDTYNQAANDLLTPLKVGIIDVYGWAVKKCGDPRKWEYGCDIIPQTNCSTGCGKCKSDKDCTGNGHAGSKSHCSGGQCRNCINCDACQVHPGKWPDPKTGFMSGGDYVSIPVAEAVMKALGKDVNSLYV